jgi:hypothetical protein
MGPLLMLIQSRMVDIEVHTGMTLEIQIWLNKFHLKSIQDKNIALAKSSQNQVKYYFKKKDRHP